MGLFGTVLKGVTSLIGSNSAKNASAKAQAEMSAKLQQAINQSQANYEGIRADYAGARSVLNPAVTGIGDLLGVNGDQATQSAFDRIKASPLYESLYRNGEEAILQNAAATGGIRGGNTQRGLADFAADTFAQLIQRQLGNLGGLANIGLGATGATAAASTGSTENIMNLLQQMGANNATGIATRGGISSGMWSNAGQMASDIAGRFALPSSNSIGNSANVGAMANINAILSNTSKLF